MIVALLMAFQLAAAEAPLPDASQEARAQGLMREIRCVVCENEPVSQSTADIAVDMRRKIREQVSEEKSDGAIRGYFTERYGGYVSFRSPTGGLGLVLWVFSVAWLAGVAGLIGWGSFRSRHRDLAPVQDDGGGEPQG